MNNEPGLDMWSAEKCGLTSEDCDRQLAGLHMGFADYVQDEQRHPQDSARDRDTHANATTYVVSESSYRPYESKKVTINDAGERMSHRAIQVVSFPEVKAKSKSSPLAVTALTTAVSVQASIWPEHGDWLARRVADLAAVTQGKGDELPLLLHEYCLHNAESVDAAISMALRDFYSSIYSWQFIRRRDGRVHDLCGSALCLTMAVDYPGAPDDPGVADRAAYLAAASEGIGCLDGAGSAQALRDMVIANAFMITKEAMVQEAMHIAEPAEFIEASGGPVSPDEFLLARWWDAAMVPHHRLALSTAEYRHLTDAVGTFLAAGKCYKVKRAIDSVIRYNEIIDLIPDYIHRECFNELLVALAIGGSNSVVGYGDSLAAVIDDVLTCNCREPGHDEAAELAMGACLWYLLVPRYRARQHLSSFSSAGGEVEQGFSWRNPGMRLSNVALTTLQPGNTLHSMSWQPLWSHPDPSAAPPNRQAYIDELARRTVRRSLTDITSAGRHHVACEAAAKSVLAACDRLSDPDDLRGLSTKWCRLFDEILASSNAYSVAQHNAVRTLRTLLARIWAHTVVGNNDLASLETDIQLFMDVDHAIRQTYLLEPADGLAVRRAFFGITTSAVELSGLNPYARLSDGIGWVCSPSHNNCAPVSAPALAKLIVS